MDRLKFIAETTYNIFNLKDIIIKMDKSKHLSSIGKVEGLYPFFTNNSDLSSKMVDFYDVDDECIIANTGGVSHFKYFEGKFSYMSDNMVFKSTMGTKFVYYYLSYKNDWINYLGFTGSGIKHLDKKWFGKIKVLCPSIEEQKKIGGFLSAIDKLIDKQREKVELLKEIKKGYLQKIYSQELRFKDENGNEYPEWSIKVLGEICDFYKGKGISKSEITSQGIPAIRYGELYTKYSEKVIEVDNFTNPTNNLVLSKYNDVIIPSSGETAIDIATASCVIRDGVALGGDINVLRGDFDGLFLAYYLNSAMKNDIARIAQGASVMHLYGSGLSKLKLSLPVKQEQKKIGEFLSNLDDEINMMECSIAYYEDFKKSYMQRLFV